MNYLFNITVTIILLHNKTQPVRRQQGFLYNPPTTLNSIYRSSKNGKFKPPPYVDSQVRLIPTKPRNKYVKSLPPRSLEAKVIKLYSEKGSLEYF